MRQMQRVTHGVLAMTVALVCGACQGQERASVTSTQAAPPATTVPTPAAAPKVDRGEIADTVRTLVRDQLAALNARNLEKVLSYDSPDLVFMFHGGPNVVGAEEDRKMTSQLLADPAVHIDVKNETVDVAEAGDLAIYRATYAFTSTDAKTKTPMTEPGNVIMALKPVEGTWKIAWAVESNTGPAVPARRTSK